MTDEKIARINALAKKSRTPEGLTAEEKAEQASLRREYIDAMKGSLKNSWTTRSLWMRTATVCR